LDYCTTSGRRPPPWHQVTFASGELGPGPVEHRGVDVDGDHLRDLADQAGREEPVAAAYVQDRGGAGGDARRQPGIVVNVDVPFLGHAG
jgi:hypothetical protein